METRLHFSYYFVAISLLCTLENDLCTSLSKYIIDVKLVRSEATSGELTAFLQLMESGE